MASFWGGLEGSPRGEAENLTERSWLQQRLGWEATDSSKLVWSEAASSGLPQPPRRDL